jgi:hypothetical protein
MTEPPADHPDLPEGWRETWTPSIVSVCTWESIYGPLDPAPPVVPEPKRRAHRCDERCACPADGKSMYYAPSTGQHACQDPDCEYAHPNDG